MLHWIGSSIRRQYMKKLISKSAAGILCGTGSPANRHLKLLRESESGINNPAQATSLTHTLALLILVCLSFTGLRADELPKADEILDRYVEVTGGKAAYNKVHNELTKGTMEFTGKGIKGTIVNWEAEPNKSFTVADLEGVGKVESGSDGDVFWERSALTGPRIKSGDERDEILRASTFNPHLNWRKIYDKAEVAGTETVDGDECYKVVLTPKSGSVMTQFYSKKTGFLVKTSGIHKTQMGDIPAESFLKDYKLVDGSELRMPFTHVNRFAGQEIEMHLQSVQFNVDVPKGRFDLPDEIRALLKKSGGNDAK